MNSLDGLMLSGLQPMDTDVAEGLRKDVEKLTLKKKEDDELIVHHAVAKETGRMVEDVKKTIKKKDKRTLRSCRVDGFLSNGLEAQGAGAPELDELYSVLRTWFEKRRSDGYYVDTAALIIQFVYVIKMCQMHLIAKKKTTELTMEEMTKLKICEEKLIELAKPKSRDYCSERLRFEVGAVWLKPHVLHAHSYGNEKRIELANFVSQAVEVD